MKRPKCNDCGVPEGQQHQLGCISRVDEGVTKPDFEALRAERNFEISKIIEATAKRWNCDPSKVQHSFDFDACFCNCPKGPCEHDFKGWRAFINGGGGETVCQRCGMGAMSHSLRTSE
jgi:hypothetical protein